MNNYKNNHRKNRFKSSNDRPYRKRNGNGHKINNEFNEYRKKIDSEKKVNSLLKGFRNLSIEKFNEGNFPRKLYFVVNKKI